MSFIGSDKYTELRLNGTLKNANVVDTVPIDCSMVLAGLDDDGMSMIQMRLGKPMTVATSYPALLREATKRSFVDLRPMYVSGGCEGYVKSGMSDLLFDIKASGGSVIANELVIYQESQKLNLKVLDYCEYDPRSTGDRLFDGLESVTEVLARRVEQIPDLTEESYTLDLLRSQNKRVKKLSEEFGELMQALLRDQVDRSEVISESADLLYALQIFLAKEGISLVDVLNEVIIRNESEDNKD